MTDFDELIPELPRWNDGRGIAVIEWLRCVGSFEEAIGYTELFWPSFVEHDGAILRASEFDPDRYKRLFSRTEGNRSQVESIMNIVALYDLHTGTVDGEPRPEPGRNQLIHLGRKMQEMWQAKMEREFPGRKLVARFNEHAIEELDYWPAAEAVTDFAVTAFQLPTSHITPRCR